MNRVYRVIFRYCFQARNQSSHHACAAVRLTAAGYYLPTRPEFHQQSAIVRNSNSFCRQLAGEVFVPRVPIIYYYYYYYYYVIRPISTVRF